MRSTPRLGTPSGSPREATKTKEKKRKRKIKIQIDIWSELIIDKTAVDSILSGSQSKKKTQLIISLLSPIIRSTSTEMLSRVAGKNEEEEDAFWRKMKEFGSRKRSRRSHQVHQLQDLLQGCNDAKGQKTWRALKWKRRNGVSWLSVNQLWTQLCFSEESEKMKAKSADRRQRRVVKRRTFWIFWKLVNKKIILLS